MEFSVDTFIHDFRAEVEQNSVGVMLVKKWSEDRYVYKVYQDWSYRGFLHFEDRGGEVFVCYEPFDSVESKFTDQIREWIQNTLDKS